MERDQSKFYDSKVTYDFNSHAHVERDGNILHVFGKFSNFNSHAHVERDMSKHAKRLNISISTHTLTWSVTLC